MRASTSRNPVRVVGPAVAIALVATLSLGGCGSDADDAGGDAAAEPAAGAPAGAASAVETDVADVSEYTLTMDRMDRYFAAMANVERAMQNVPEEEREDVVDASGAVSIDDYAAALERNPAVRDAIRDAGLSAREFGLITMAYLQAGMASAEAVVEATVRRARPVVLTALAAVLAFIPLATDSFWGPMAYVLIGGTAVGTLVTLLFLPALYALFYRIKLETPAA